MTSTFLLPQDYWHLPIGSPRNKDFTGLAARETLYHEKKAFDVADGDGIALVPPALNGLYRELQRRRRGRRSPAARHNFTVVGDCDGVPTELTTRQGGRGDRLIPKDVQMRKKYNFYDPDYRQEMRKVNIITAIYLILSILVIGFSIVVLIALRRASL